MLQCIVVTPERTLYDQPAEFVAVMLFDGEIGIAPGHTPMVGRLGCGELRIRREGHTDHYYVEGGFVEVRNDVVSILTQARSRRRKLTKRSPRNDFRSPVSPGHHARGDGHSRPHVGTESRPVAHRPPGAAVIRPLVDCGTRTITLSEVRIRHGTPGAWHRTGGGKAWQSTGWRQSRSSGQLG